MHALELHYRVRVLNFQKFKDVFLDAMSDGAEGPEPKASQNGHIVSAVLNGRQPALYLFCWITDELGVFPLKHQMFSEKKFLSC